MVPGAIEIMWQPAAGIATRPPSGTVLLWQSFSYSMSASLCFTIVVDVARRVRIVTGLERRCSGGTYAPSATGTGTAARSTTTTTPAARSPPAHALTALSR
jgi:hypothetical protein